MLKSRLQWWIEYKSVLPKCQSGFRKGQCTIDNLVNFTVIVEDSFNNKKDVLAAFLDVSGAFDNVNIEILLQRLSVIGCPKNFIKFIKFLMSERLIYTEDISP